MADKKELFTETTLRVVYYILAMCCFFLVFILAVAFAPERLDTEIILILIIAVLLISFMLNTSHRLKSIQENINTLSEQMKRSK